MAHIVQQPLSSWYVLNVPSLGLGRVASLGKVIRLRADIGKYAVSPTMSVLQFSNNVTIDYIYASMNSAQIQQQFEGKSNGSTRQSVGTEMVHILNLAIPADIKEQQQIGTYFSKLTRLITLHQRKCLDRYEKAPFAPTKRSELCKL
ncbi:restriction endonuclease subunit S [Gemmiger sp.]|uniref:restriction endonuclease subunit S n=1 Tax=Gemmiger sp. TaxID=2049027 RepID=UPI003FD7AB97